VHVSYDISNNNGLWSIPSNPVVVKAFMLKRQRGTWVIVDGDLPYMFGAL
jgi:hypothetical protein